MRALVKLQEIGGDNLIQGLVLVDSSSSKTTIVVYWFMVSLLDGFLTKCLSIVVAACLKTPRFRITTALVFLILVVIFIIFNFFEMITYSFMCRGENRLAGWEYRPVPNQPNRCLLRMIVGTDIKVMHVKLVRSL
jgi:hypothetical protein